MTNKFAELTVYSFVFSILISVSHSCFKGYYGSPCKECPVNTYKDFVGYAASCTPCPQYSGHSLIGSSSINDCRCFIGYFGYPEKGTPCQIRHCDSLSAPSNGVIKGGQCSSHYLSVCQMECNEGYEPLGSTQRRCIANQVDFMVWSGDPMQCTVIRCPLMQVPFADPPTGKCTPRWPEYNSRCTFTCLIGYRLKGSHERVCELDKSWSGGPTSCEQIFCPKLQIVQAGITLTPSFCATGPVPAYSYCRITCPSGYTIQGNPQSWPDFTLICLLNETWSDSIPTCRDFQPPKLKCPHGIQANSSKGKATAKVIWSIQVSDNSVQVDPNAVIRVRSSHVSGQEFPIGVTDIRINATDDAGNTGVCSFVVHVRDTEPPSCSFCPADIVQEVTTATVPVSWKTPICSDNSGVPPTIQSNRQSGAEFFVPSTSLIEYTVSDHSLNVYNNCSFKVILKVKACTMFSPPRNGALVCFTAHQQAVCSAFCKDDADFEFNPPLVYICSGGKWDYWAYPGVIVQNAPWPNCSGSASPSWIKTNAFFQQWYYYSGDAHDSSVQGVIKSQFHGLLTSNTVPPICQYQTCNKNDFTVSPGVTD